MSFILKIVCEENERFTPTALDKNVGKKVTVKGQEVTILSVEVIEDGKAALVLFGDEDQEPIVNLTVGDVSDLSIGEE